MTSLGSRLERMAVVLLRLPLRLVVAVVVLVVLDAFGLPIAFAAARLGVNLLLACYLLAGLVNLPRFPRASRGPATLAIADALLLDMWTVLSIAAGIAMASGNLTAGLV